MRNKWCEKLVQILGLGTAFADTLVNQTEAAEVSKRYCCQTARQSRIVEQLYSRSGIVSRSTVLGQRGVEKFFDDPYLAQLGPRTAERMSRYSQEIIPLSAKSSLSALSRSSVCPCDITHLITVSCTGFSAPGTDIALIKNLALPANVRRCNIGFMGCHGALNGLAVAKALAHSDPKARILLCAAEICSIHFQQQWTSDNMVANTLFADGSAALILGQAETQAYDFAVVDSASYVLEDTQQEMTWTIGNHGFVMTLSRKVPELIASALPAFLASWLQGHRLEIEDIAGWAVHPGDRRILQAVQECLKLSDHMLEPSYEVFRTYGNMSSPTILFILEKLRQAAVKGPLVLLGFGPGLTIEAALLKARGDD